MRELNTTELSQVSGGFGLGAMVNSNITAILATNTGRNVAIQAASGMLNHAMYNLSECAVKLRRSRYGGDIRRGLRSSPKNVQFQSGVFCCSIYCRIMEIGAPPQLPAK